MGQIWRYIQKNNLSILLAICFSVSISLSSYILFLQNPYLVGKKDILFALLTGIVFFLLTFLVIKKWVLSNWMEQKRSVQWSLVIGAFLIAFFLLLQINIWKTPYFNFLLNQHHLTITSPGLQSDSSGDAMTRLTTFNYGLGEVDLSQMEGDEGWIFENGQWISSGHSPFELQWQGRIIGKASIEFSTDPVGGDIKILWDGEESILSLNSSQPGTTLIILRDDISTANYLLANLCLLITITFCLWIFSCLTLSFLQPGQNDNSILLIKHPKWTVWIILCIPMVLVWGLFWAVFSPAVMSQDSISQWSQTTSGQINDWAPAIHTIILGLTGKLFGSPALFTALQVLLFSGIAAWGLTQLVMRGLPLWLALLLSGLFALSPVNSVYSITIWKDISYAIFLFCLTIQVFCILTSRGKWLSSP